MKTARYGKYCIFIRPDQKFDIWYGEWIGGYSIKASGIIVNGRIEIVEVPYRKAIPKAVIRKLQELL